MYRLGILVAIVALVRDHHVRLRIAGDNPLSVEEVTEIFPEAASLHADHSEKAGMFVQDAGGDTIGYVIRTFPAANSLIGYAGPTDTLIGFDSELKVVGVRIRSSEDTHTHVASVKADSYHMNLFNDRTWEELGSMDLRAAGVEGVSGSTMTSITMAEGIQLRIQEANQQLAKSPKFRFTSADAGLLFVIAGAAIIGFSKLRGRPRVRRGFQVIVVLYIGFVNGSLIAQSLLAGWAKTSIPWHMAPGLVLLVAAALLVPMVAHKPFYCHQLCPHGAAQEWLGRLLPRKWKLHLPSDLTRSLRWLPPALLAGVLLIVMLNAPVDLAGVEAFDAYLLTSAGIATITIAITGLVASLFIPQAYCKFGCPTGALLEFTRSHGKSDKFGQRDLYAVVLLLIAALLYWNYDALNAWFLGPAAP